MEHTIYQGIGDLVDGVVAIFLVVCAVVLYWRFK